jgi:hypothetical protein
MLKPTLNNPKFGEIGKSDKVCRLNKAPLVVTLTNYFKTLGFELLTADNCIFYDGKSTISRNSSTISSLLPPPNQIVISSKESWAKDSTSKVNVRVLT